MASTRSSYSTSRCSAYVRIRGHEAINELVIKADNDIDQILLFDSSGLSFQNIEKHLMSDSVAPEYLMSCPPQGVGNEILGIVINTKSNQSNRTLQVAFKALEGHSRTLRITMIFRLPKEHSQSIEVPFPALSMHEPMESENNVERREERGSGGNLIRSEPVGARAPSREHPDTSAQGARNRESNDELSGDTSDHGGYANEGYGFDSIGDIASHGHSHGIEIAAPSRLRITGPFSSSQALEWLGRCLFVVKPIPLGAQAVTIRYRHASLTTDLTLTYQRGAIEAVSDNASALAIIREVSLHSLVSIDRYSRILVCSIFLLAL